MAPINWLQPDEPPERPAATGEHEDAITVGNVTGSSAIAIGHGAQARVFEAGATLIEAGANFYERQPMPAPWQAPSLPEHYLPRPDYATALTQFLHSPEHLVVAATGLEGIGKTTLAMAVAAENSDRFRDGVLWAEFAGDLHEMLASILVAMDLDVGSIRRDSDRAKAIRSALRHRSVLLVVDNFTMPDMDPRSLLPFGDSRILITTPDRDLASDLTGAQLDVGPLTNPDAIALLRGFLGPGLTDLPQATVNRLVRETGGVPELVVTIGRQGRRIVRRGREELLKWAENSRIDWSDLTSVLEFSLLQLSDDDRRAFALMGALGAAPFDAQMVAEALGIDTLASELLLDNLEAHSLLERTQDGRFEGRKSILIQASKSLASVRDAPEMRRGLAGYLGSWSRLTSNTDPRLAANLAHARALFDICVEAEDWDLLADLAAMPLETVAATDGQFRLVHETNMFLAEFRSTSFRGALIHATYLGGAMASGADFSGATISSVDAPASRFRGCNFTSASFLNADLRGSDFRGCNFGESRFAKVDLRHASFVGCDFTDFTMVDTLVVGARFIGCTFDRFVTTNVGWEASEFQGCVGAPAGFGAPVVSGSRDEPIAS